MILIRIFAVFVFVMLSGCAIQSPLVAAATGDGTYWVLKEPLVYEDPQSKESITVPRGFVTDFASVPRLFWTAFPACEKYTPAAVVHDYLYWEQPHTCDRKCADDILLTAMTGSNVGVITRNAIYAGVRAGGSRAWDANAAAKEEGSIRNVPDEFLEFSPNDTWADIEDRIRSAPSFD